MEILINSGLFVQIVFLNGFALVKQRQRATYWKIVNKKIAVFMVQGAWSSTSSPLTNVGVQATKLD